MTRRRYRPRNNGWTEELGAVIGTSATLRLIAVFGGSSLYIPAGTSDDHVIAHVIGSTAFSHLVQAFGGDVLPIPLGDEFSYLRKVRRTVELQAAGETVAAIAKKFGCSERQVRNYRYAATDMGLGKRRLPRD